MATKGAIGKMRKDALNRISGTVGALQMQFGIEALDLESVRYRDPAYEHAARLTRLAEWLEALTFRLGEAGVDLAGARVVSEQVDTIRLILDQSLNAMNTKDLKAKLAELGSDFKGAIKQEFVNEIVTILTGQPLRTISLNDLTEAEESPDEEDDA